MATFGLKCQGVHGIEGGEEITLVSPGVKPGAASITMSIWAPRGDGVCGKFKPGKHYALDLKGFEVTVPDRRELNPQVADRDTVVAVAATVMEAAGTPSQEGEGSARRLATNEALKQIEDSLALIDSGDEDYGSLNLIQLETDEAFAEEK